MESNVRRSATRELEVFEISDLVIDVARQRVTRAAAEIALPNLSFDLLLVLIRAAPAVVSNDDLMAQVWPGLVVSPETVSQRVKLLRHALGDDPRAPRYIAGLRGRGYRLIPEVRSIAEDSSHTSPQPVPVQSGSAESRPPRSIEPEMTSQPRARARTRVIFGVIAALALMGVATYAFFALRPQPAAPKPDSVTVVGLPPRTVAVLPFENLSPDPANLSADAADDYLVDGLSEELINRLANVPGLQVSARTSSTYFRQRRAETAQTIGRMLGVAFLVEGSVRRSGQTLRVTVQLVDARTGFHVASHVLERPFSDVLAMQDEISLAILEKLEVPLIEQARAAVLSRSTSSPEALDLYLQARHADQQWTLPENDRAIGLYRKAIALDGKFSLAYLALANALMARTQIAQLPPRHPGVSEAEALLRTAIELDPDSADVHALMATLLMSRLELRAAEEEARLAESLNPGTEGALYHLTKYYAFVGWPPDKGIGYAERWFRIDPLNPWAECNVAIAQLHAHRYEDSLRTIDSVLQREASYWVGQFIRTGALMELERLDDALVSARRAVELHDSVETRTDLAVVYALRGEVATSQRIFAGLLTAHSRAYLRPSLRSSVAVALGDNEGALTALEQSISEGDSDAIQNLHWRLFSPLHDEPRFQDLVRRFEQERRLALLIERTQHLPPWPH
jgi:TolB-like protein/DNA-binding winged helix-turn-helix (wHTH) protein